MKKFISLFLCLTLLLCNVAMASAESNQKLQIRNSKGKIVNFTIEPNSKGKFTMDELYSIANSNTDTDNITIHEIGYADKKGIELSSISSNISSSISIKSIPIYVPGSTVTKVTKKNVLESDRFIESCAKGETLTIQKTIKESLNLDLSGDLRYGKMGLNGSVEYTLKKGKKLVGPPESSEKNCREYRCKFFENHGTWTQIWTHSNPTRPVVHSGTFKEPSKYYSYSKDIKI